MGFFFKALNRVSFFLQLFLIPSSFTSIAGKMKHSIWLMEVAHPESEIATASRTVEEVVDAPYSKVFSFRRIWQGTCSQCAASKVIVHTCFVSR